jgi:hypothetical protein
MSRTARTQSGEPLALRAARVERLAGAAPRASVKVAAGCIRQLIDHGATCIQGVVVVLVELLFCVEEAVQPVFRVVVVAVVPSLVDRDLVGSQLAAPIVARCLSATSLAAGGNTSSGTPVLAVPTTGLMIGPPDRWSDVAVAPPAVSPPIDAADATPAGMSVATAARTAIAAPILVLRSARTPMRCLTTVGWYADNEGLPELCDVPTKDGGAPAPVPVRLVTRPQGSWAGGIAAPHGRPTHAGPALKSGH